MNTILIIIAISAIAAPFITYNIGKEKGLKKGYHEAFHDVGVHVKDASFWFKERDVSNVLMIIGTKLIKRNWFSADRLRDSVYKLRDQDRVIHKSTADEVSEHFI